MKVLQINSVSQTGSTGKIAVAISNILDEKNVENRILYSFGNSDHKNSFKYSNDLYIKLQALKSRVLGNYGFNSKLATKKLISKIKEFAPDIVHIHNIHGHDCDLDMLLTYLKNSGTKVVWTFHDCWMLTGYCPHFDMIGCNNWKTACHSCPQRKAYSFFFDKSKKLQQKKKKLIEELDITIVTPSKWLADTVLQSSINATDVRVINNGIDLSVFKPTESNFRKERGLENKYIVLGVSFDWSKRKGLDVFIELSRSLPEKYQIVLIGTNDTIDKLLPPNIISIHKTNCQEDLAKIYTSADILVNPTREEIFGLVNVEALACGTPGVTFKTGGSPECYDASCGSTVEKDDVNSLRKEIISICSENLYSKENCIAYSKQFDKNIKFSQYVELYKELSQNKEKS